MVAAKVVLGLSGLETASDQLILTSFVLETVENGLIITLDQKFWRAVPYIHANRLIGQDNLHQLTDILPKPCVPF